MVSPLLSRAEVFSFEPLLQARAAALGPLKVSVDGGAGWGDTAKTIVASTSPDGVIYAFEPFPGNHGFFADADPRIQLVKAAIADAPGQARFLVGHVVQDSEQWADKGLAGYSSVGHLANAAGDPLWKRVARRLRDSVQPRTGKPAMSIDVTVTTVRETVKQSHIDFVKLDLQGAELKALIGMGNLLAETEMLWIEFNNQPGLFEFLCNQGFLLFDTNYLCVNTTPEQLQGAGLQACRPVTLSTSHQAILASRRVETRDYVDWFSTARKQAGVWQTDLLAVNPRFLKAFFAVLGRLA